MRKIENIRNKMISVGMSEGLTSPNTIKLSEILDKLINLKLSSY
ncbi:aspartyl-phosphate phosphatase Spo0E family protein [Neobacillus sp. 3P2-tot-E-2]